MRVKIRGRYFDLRFVNRLAEDKKTIEIGNCDPPHVNAKAIRIRRGLEPKEELDTTLHELLHAGHWDLKEEVVGEMASDMAAVLWALGYRKAGIVKGAKDGQAPAKRAADRKKEG